MMRAAMANLKSSEGEPAAHHVRRATAEDAMRTMIGLRARRSAARGPKESAGPPKSAASGHRQRGVGVIARHGVARLALTVAVSALK
jgi:hypothetical protein